MNAATEIQGIKELWKALFPAIEAPEDSQWTLWFLLYDVETVRRGVAQLAAKHRKLHGEMSPDYMAKFASSVMNRLSREAPQHQ